MLEDNGPSIRVLADRFQVSHGKAVCRVGVRPTHPIPFGWAYHNVVEIVDGEFRAITACSEHDPYFAPEEFDLRADLALAERESRSSKFLNSSGLRNALGLLGIKPVQAVTPNGTTYRIRDVILAADGKALILNVE